MADIQTFYYEFPDGRLSERQTTEENPTHPEGATLLDAEEYSSKLAAWQAAREQEEAETRAAEEAQKKGAYDALIAAGFDPAVAQTLSGYTPPVGGA
ncbi:hypothetical protein [[Kitasatospora] papulosa]|uniref:hypothetical protein n=1 Tax=[Kitasatospora] papulosa TaxID=1464011 RepID=UPI00368959A0